MRIEITEMIVIQLDDARHALRVSRKQVCERAGINQSTYQRWLKWAHGEPKGSRPQPRTIRALREALSAEFEQRGDSRFTIADLLQPPNAGDPPGAPSAKDKRDGRENTGAVEEDGMIGV